MKDAILYKILRPLITGFYKLFFRPKFIGTENIPISGRVVLAGNHTSNFDAALLISATKRNVHFLAKKELWNGPKKIIFGNLGLIPVDRKSKDGNALIIAERYLKKEKLIGIFPEGTTEKTGELLKFKKGAVKMATDTNSPIVPFVITGKYKLFSKDLTIKFLEPIKCDGDIKEETERLMNIIKEERENLRWIYLHF